MGFGFVFGILELLVPVVFLLVIGVFVATMVSGLRTWNRNNQSPRLTVPAVVVTKRTEISHHHANAGDASGAHGFHTTSATWYYVTFQVESGDRMELRVDGQEYGMLVGGDQGRLTFQGTRYQGFQRTNAHFH